MRIKPNVTLLTVCLFIWLGISGCKDDASEPDVALTGISLNKTGEAINGVEKSLTVTFTPENATNKNVTWTSSNPSVATISNSKVLAVADGGTTTITATSEDGGHTATCTITAVARCKAVNKGNEERCKNKANENGYCTTHKDQATE